MPLQSKGNTFWRQILPFTSMKPKQQHENFKFFPSQPSPIELNVNR